MRILALVIATLLTGACWTPGPGQLDPTRYPWDQPRRPSTYCIVSLEVGSASGITVGGRQTAQLSCEQPRSRRAPPGTIEAKGSVPRP